MNPYQLRTEPSQGPYARPVLLLDWFDSRAGSTIQYRGALRGNLRIPAGALDLLKVAAAVYCADRLTIRPPTWTRSIAMSLAVREPETWNAVKDDLSEVLSFLSGDRWQLEVRPSSEPIAVPSQLSAPVDAVCLFSGGLDSFTGALDLLAQGNRVCLVGHHGAGQGNQVQQGLWSALARRYPKQCVLRQFFLQPAAPKTGQRRPLPSPREPSQRSRSLLFLAAGLTVAAGYGPQVPLCIPENGFIGINVPLTGARAGSLSTRTTHPHFIESFSRCIQGLGLTNQIVNPFRTMTKGEILGACQDQETLRRLADQTLSCAHPETARWAREEQTNCGYCFPCLIRRASMYQVGLDQPASYTYDVLADDPELALEKGSDLRALVRSLNRPSKPADALRNGPVPTADVAAFADVYRRGRQEILTWMRASATSSSLRNQLPRP
jgi:7-cyano-7-deazaguanine synthase in queuosine biosynthesis